MATVKRYPTDEKKLLDELKKRGIQSFSQACMEMGRAHNFLTEQVKRGGGLTEPSMKFLQLRFNIQPEDIAPDVKEEIKEPEQMKIGESVPQAVEIDYQMLFKVIYKAVLAATKQAHKELYGESEVMEKG